MPTVRELSNLVYDTLFQNTQYPQLNLDEIVHQEVDDGLGVIHIETKDESFVINICRTHKHTPEELG